MLFQRRWRPYTPEVTQLLERAYSKNLRSVFLGDSDPALKNYCVHLPEMEQECKASGDVFHKDLLMLCYVYFKWLPELSGREPLRGSLVLAAWQASPNSIHAKH